MVNNVFLSAGRGAVLQLSDIITNALINHQKIQMIYDFDGTLFPFCDDPTQVKLDEGCKSALLALSQKENVQMTGLTGRDLGAAQTMMAGVNINIVGSHGAEFRSADGHIEKYPFTKDQLTHIQTAREAVDVLKNQFPELHIEANKYGSIGINLSRYAGQDDVRDAVFSVIGKYQNESFSIAYEGRKGDDLGWEIELRPAEHVCGKHIGITHFIKPDRDILTIFCGDSLGEHGTDTPAATLINDKQEFLNGIVVMVMNGRNKVPDVGSPQSPAFVMISPKALGEQLTLALPKISPQQDFKPLCLDGMHP